MLRITRHSHPDLQEATSKALCSGHTLNLSSTGLQTGACSPSLHPTKQDQAGVSLCRLILTLAGKQVLQLGHSHLRESVDTWCLKAEEETRPSQRLAEGPTVQSQLVASLLQKEKPLSLYCGFQILLNEKLLSLHNNIKHDLYITELQAKGFQTHSKRLLCSWGPDSYHIMHLHTADRNHDSSMTLFRALEADGLLHLRCRTLTGAKG